MLSAIYIGLITGLIGSFHCLGMCGPLVLALPMGSFSKQKKIAALLTYHFFRVMGYLLIGFIIGMFGEAAGVFGLQRELSIVGGLLIISFTLFHYRLPSFSGKIQKWIARLVKKQKLYAFPIMGFLNAFLPCGMSFLAIATALAYGNTIYSTTFLFFFGFGNSLVLISAYFGWVALKNRFRLNMNRFLPIYSILLGLFLILRGSNLGIPYVSPENLGELFNPVARHIPLCH
ncbi:sulfite exporter TauE/SafE family protein [Marinilongibacter aquaticus]|uniref:sulfite exporter TauE/SafE family protein n=1 Tax=Marinilongibacter aquaticus TaxID=2975157 RepID=UPI0021BD7E4F|nr:sulfite exporter TauE/SafE family protein [Marinilongibacter aquaticus]UBM58548.1 sulfite exporter TauE/SafE family protein [Marinilongibacter aquaticus]